MTQGTNATPWLVTIERTQSKLLSALSSSHADRDSAWRAFLEAYIPVLSRYAEQSGASPGEVGEVVAEVVAKFCARIESGWKYQRGSEPGRFRAFLRVTVVRTTRRMMAKSGRFVPLGDPDPESDPTSYEQERLEAAERQVVFDNAVAAIRDQTSPQQFTAWELQALKGSSAADIARDLGVSVEVVYQYKTRVNKRLKKEVERLLALQDK